MVKTLRRSVVFETSLTVEKSSNYYAISVKQSNHYAIAILCAFVRKSAREPHTRVNSSISMDQAIFIRYS